MKTHVLERAVFLPRAREEIFPFFANARNLEILTPPFLRFEVVTEGEIQMAEGTRIDYKLRVHGIPIRWQSEITTWEPPHRFVDEQRRGPYRLWRHLHAFEEVDGGTRAIDRVEYAVPGGPLVHRLFVRGDVERIFEYRSRKLREIFSDVAAGASS